MNTFLLTWNSTKWTDPDHWVDEAIAATEAGATWPGRWGYTGNRVSGIIDGDWGYFMRQHEDRGIIALVEFTSPIYPDEHWSGVAGAMANYADFEVVDWLKPADRLPVEVLEQKVPEVGWDRLQGSGVKVFDDTAELLDDLWIEHLAQLGRHAPLTPEELDLSDVYPEGAAARVLVNRYERDGLARAICLKHFGARCVVCGFDFETVYGELGKGYIHFHHIREISTLPDGYRVDPVEDLRPVCPNCHAMLHRDRPPMPIPELKRRLLVTTDAPEVRISRD